MLLNNNQYRKYSLKLINDSIILLKNTFAYYPNPEKTYNFPDRIIIIASQNPRTTSNTDLRTPIKDTITPLPCIKSNDPTIITATIKENVIFYIAP